MSEPIYYGTTSAVTITAMGGRTPAQRDAEVLRMAARILGKHSKRPFVLRVIIRVLELHADRLEKTP